MSRPPEPQHDVPMGDTDIGDHSPSDALDARNAEDARSATRTTEQRDGEGDHTSTHDDGDGRHVPDHNDGTEDPDKDEDASIQRERGPKTPFDEEHDDEEQGGERTRGGEDEDDDGDEYEGDEGDEDDEEREDPDDGPGGSRTATHVQIQPGDAPRAQRRATQAVQEASKKAGNPGNFHGAHFAFLEDLIEDYLALKATKGKGRNNRYEKFWGRVRAAWWDRFSWEEFPDFGDTREVVIEKVNKAIKGWYRYRAVNGERATKDPFAPVTAELRKKPPAQRKVAAYQYWARENKEVVDAAAGPSAKDIGKRNRIARELFEKEDEEVKRAMRELAASTYETAAKSFAERLDALPDPTYEEACLARKRFGKSMKPFMRSIARAMGYSCISMFGGVATPDDPDNAFSWVAVHHGETKDVIPKNLATYDKKGFEGMIGTFLDFVKEVEVPAQAPSGEADKDATPGRATERRMASTEVDIDATPGQATERRHLASAQPHINNDHPPTHNPMSLASSSREPPTTRPAPRRVPPRAEPLPAWLDPQRWPTLASNISALRGAARAAEVERLDGLEDFDMNKEENMARNKIAISQCQDSLPKQLQARRKEGHQTGRTVRRSPDGTNDSDDDGTFEPEDTNTTHNPSSQRSLRPRTGKQTDSQPRDRQTDPQPATPVSPESQSPTTTPPPQPDAITPEVSRNRSPSLPAPEPDPATGDGVTLPSLPNPPAHDDTGAPKPPAEPTTVAPRVADLSSAPEWLRDFHRTFAEAPHAPDVYAAWNSILANWVALESAFEYANMHTGLSASNRPAEIAVWIRFARENPIAVKNADKYATSWWRWWDTINPSWRARVDGRLQQGGKGDWSSFFRTGKNGFLTVLASLVALEQSTPEECWRSAIADVDWVLGEVRAAAEAQGSTRPDSSSPNKRPSANAETSGSAVQPRKRVRTSE